MDNISLKCKVWWISTHLNHPLLKILDTFGTQYSSIMTLPYYTCPPQSKQLSICLSPAIHITVLKLSGNFVLQSILSWCLVSFTQHFVSMLFHVSLGYSILLNSILLYECTTIYLSIFLLMVIWIISNLGLLWTNVLIHFLSFL